MESLKRLEAWFTETCDGEWEKSNGIILETIETPGWLLTIEVKKSPLREKAFQPVAERYGESDWVFCFVEKGIFKGSGALGSLDRILTIFLDWVEKRH